MIKYIFVIGGFLSVFAVVEVKKLVKNHYHDKMVSMSQNASEYGCYSGAKLSCAFLSDDIQRGKCFDQALEWCPVVGLNYKNWIDGNQK